MLALSRVTIIRITALRVCGEHICTSSHLILIFQIENPLYLLLSNINIKTIVFHYSNYYFPLFFNIKTIFFSLYKLTIIPPLLFNIKLERKIFLMENYDSPDRSVSYQHKRIFRRIESYRRIFEFLCPVRANLVTMLFMWTLKYLFR